MKISVVIPNYNNPQLLAQCLNSIIKAEPNLSRYSITVVDDGSTEANLVFIRDICSEHTNLSLIEHGSNRFFSQAVNTGIEATNGELVLLVNSDVVCVTPFIDSFVKAFEADEKLGIAGAVLLYADGKIQHAGVGLTKYNWFAHIGLNEPFTLKSPHAVSRYSLGVTGAFMAIRRKMLDDIGLFNTSYVGAYEDIEMCLRCWNAAWTVLMEGKIYAFHLEGVTRGANTARKMELNPYMWYREQATIKLLQQTIDSTSLLKTALTSLSEAAQRKMT